MALKLEALRKSFGGLRVLNGVTMSVEPGERRAIIGPNGAGKTTLFNLISGELSATSGRVCLQGRDVTELKPHQRSVLGLARTFQKNNLFLGLSVFENVRLAVQRYRGISRNFFTPVGKFEAITTETYEILGQVGLSGQERVKAKNLSYGEQRQLEMAIALATGPKVLLLDEPTAGMSPAETTRTTQMIANLPKDLTLIIIEHDMDVVFSLAGRVMVLHYGEVLADGLPGEVKANPRVLEVYLGAEGEEAAHA